MKNQEKGKSKKIKKGILIVLIFIFVFFLLVLGYSHFIVPKRLDVKEYRIENEKLNSIHGYKIAHISDIHLGGTTSLQDLEKLVEKINRVKPNILFFTGDLIDKDTTLTEKMKEEIENTLGKLDINILKYSIKGEDDLKFREFDFIMENAGFIPLDNTYKILYVNQTDYLLLAGVSSTKLENVENNFEPIKEFTDTLEPKPLYSILLLHEPDFIEEMDASFFTLILAGHSHGGQVKLPFLGGIGYPKYAREYHADVQKVKDSDFFISSGIGTTRYGFRLFNNPSFNVYRLVSY